MIARRDSVTVSMAADNSGIFRGIEAVRRVVRLTSRGRTVEWAGSRRTSSNVSAFWMTRIQKPSPQNEIIQIATFTDNRTGLPDVAREPRIDAPVVSR